jgi:hypothetical protein
MAEFRPTQYKNILFQKLNMMTDSCGKECSQYVRLFLPQSAHLAVVPRRSLMLLVNTYKNTRKAAYYGYYAHTDSPNNFQQPFSFFYKRGKAPTLVPDFPRLNSPPKSSRRSALPERIQLFQYI